MIGEGKVGRLGRERWEDWGGKGGMIGEGEWDDWGGRVG